MPPAKPIGELAVVALKARNLPDREIVGKQDPFCVFRLGDQAKKTKTDHRGGQHPLWDDQVNLIVPEGKTKMIVQLFDEDKRKEDLISEGEVDLTHVLKEGEQDEWFDLQYKGRPAGQIYLELTFYSASAPPRPTNQPVRMPPQQRPHGAPVHPQQRPGPPPPGQNVPGVGPAPYRPPPPPEQFQQANQMARPHVPPPLNGPQPSSNSTPLYPHNRPTNARPSPPGAYNRPPQTYPSQPAGPSQPYPSAGTPQSYPNQRPGPPQPYPNQPPGPSQSYPSQPGGSSQSYPSQPGGPPQAYPNQPPPQAYPNPHVGGGGPRPPPAHSPPDGYNRPPYPPSQQPPGAYPSTSPQNQSTSLLTSAYNPQNRPPPPQSPHSQQYPSGGFSGGFQPMPPPPPQGQRPPYGGGPAMAIPEPQHYSNYQPSFDDNGQPFAAHNSPYPSSAARPMPGYPPYPPR
ncbi:hypothetical protein BC943DRAFT_361224 [Umbelopsis sp. AD052]|nr:hypothetical protein BC943DRAFT_361224 [Umbelopsis sp. AD052]